MPRSGGISDLKMKLWIRLCLNTALGAGLIGLFGLAPAVHAADDTARFFGQWKTTFTYNGQTVTIISVHDANGYRNYALTPTGFTFVGSGVFSAANGIWFAAAAPPDNGGTYHFVDNNTAICSNAVGQTVTWKRDSTRLTGVAVATSQPEATASNPLSGATGPPSRPSDHAASAAVQGRQQRGFEEAPEITTRSLSALMTTRRLCPNCKPRSTTLNRSPACWAANMVFK